MSNVEVESHARHVPPRVADVEELADRAQVDGLVTERPLAVLEQERDLLGHVGAWRSLWQPAVATLGRSKKK